LKKIVNNSVSIEIFSLELIDLPPNLEKFKMIDLIWNELEKNLND